MISTFSKVNRKGDEIAQIATGYTPIEITFFKGIVRLLRLCRRGVEV